MNKKRIYILVAVIVVILILIIIFSKGNNQQTVNAPTGNVSETEQGAEEKNKTKFEVPENIVVPELETKSPDESVAIPLTVAPAAPQSESKFRRFEIRGEGDKYIPSEVIVNQNDIVHIDFTAVDKQYDMTLPDYGMQAVAAKGETKIFEFQAVAAGKFLYYCEMCGGLEGKTKGYITVVPPKAD